MKKAVIIGAGPAGLTAAYKLLKETDIKPVIYEETDVIGGISQTFKYKGNRMDVGGHRFFTKNEEVMNTWKELMKPQGSVALDEKLLGIDKTFGCNSATACCSSRVTRSMPTISRLRPTTL